MNILGSYNWMKEYLKTDLAPEVFGREISLRSASVEAMHDLAAQYDHMVIGVVDSIETHPKADRLKLVKTNVGDKVLTIVCGGSNVREGQKVVVALPGSRVRWHGEGELITLEPAVIRGIASEGMICAPGEIGFEKAPCVEGGIWDLTDICDAPAGTAVAKALGLEDILFDLEVTTNRPDSMSIIGLAREAAACGLGEFTWKPSAPVQSAASASMPLSVSVESSDLCPRYMAVALNDVKVGPSPLWLQVRLLLAGHRPINNVVDVTNYILHEYGQPLHAFDYDKVAEGAITVRTAKKGEVLKALDGKEYKLTATQLVIADGNGPLAVAGVMGGEVSGTYATTTRIVLEAATFDGASVRRTARDLNLYSDAQSMFEKGLSTESLPAALARAVELLKDLAGAMVASEVVDVQAEPYTSKTFTLDPLRVNQLLGVEIAEKEQVTILETLGFVCEKNGATYTVTVPYYRDHDIEENVDLVEEIARVYGYHNVPSRMPDGRLPTRVQDPHLFFEESWKSQLVALGYTEFFSNSLVSASDLERVNVDPANAVAIHNPLTADLTHMRTTLVASLLKGVELNQAHHRQGKVFEISRVYTPRKGDLPLETTDVLLAQFGYADAFTAFRELQGVLQDLLVHGGAFARLERLEKHDLLHGTRAARIFIGDLEVGFAGEVKEEVRTRFGVDVPVFVAVLHTQDLMPTLHVTRSYTAEPAFPSVQRDMSLLLNADAEFVALEEAIHAVDLRVRAVRFVEQYVGKGIPEGKKSVTLGITLRDDAATLEGAAIETIMGDIQKKLETEFGAQIR